MDYYDRYRRRDYADEERERERERPLHHHQRRHRRRFDKYRVTGMLLMFFGISILALGVFDMGWTVARYGNNCQAPFDWPNACLGNHTYIYVGSPLWGGALLICVAFLALGIHPDKENHRRAHRHFLIMLAINMILILPAIIALMALEIYYGMNYFWSYGGTNGAFVAYDTFQFGLPIAICVLAGMAFNVILFFAVFMYCCSDDYGSYRGRRRRHYGEREDDDSSYRGRHASHDPYRNYYRGQQGYSNGGFYGGAGKRYFYN